MPQATPNSVIIAAIVIATTGFQQADAIAGFFIAALIAQAALSVHKSEMTRLLQVADSIPEYIAQAIGPAPKAGRPRWQALGDLISKDIGGLAMDETRSQPFRDADSDTRFQRLFGSSNSSVFR